jgi:hypothetical protein
MRDQDEYGQDRSGSALLLVLHTRTSNDLYMHARLRIIQRWLHAALAIGPVVAAGTAAGAVVCSGPVDLNVPATAEGLYVNLVNGVSGGSEGQVPGFDFDPYAAQGSTPSGQLKFYWGPSSNGGAGVVSSGDTYAMLQPGDGIGATSSFSRAAFTGDTSAWQAGTTAGYLGMRFTNESSGEINYGWLHLTTTAPLGFPMTLLDWCYDDSGAAITIDVAVDDDIFCDGYDGLTCAASSSKDAGH